MGITTSTSLSNLKDNAVLQRFIGLQPVPQGDKLWAELVTFSYSPLNSTYVMSVPERPLQRKNKIDERLRVFLVHSVSCAMVRWFVQLERTYSIPLLTFAFIGVYFHSLRSMEMKLMEETLSHQLDTLGNYVEL